MILDASAVLAVLLEEKSSPAVISVLLNNVGNLRMSHVTLAEVVMTLTKRGAEREEALAVVQDMLQRLDAELVATTTEQVAQAALAREAFGVNFGDCFVYALAREYRAPVLTLDEDFRRTDVNVVPLG